MFDLIAEHPLLASVLAFVAFCVIVSLYDITQKHHTILHNFPVVGHLRYFLEMVGPEMRQYWVANDKEEMPFNRDERSWIYASAKGENNTFGFGSTEQMYGIGYPIVKQAAFPFPDYRAYHINGDPSAVPCLKVMGAAHNRRRPYRPRSIINISAMSFGSLGERAISALNLGAAQADCYHNSGEGGVSPYHCLGGDIVWQLGTGYFGARGPDGKFSVEEMVRKTTENDKIRAIEIKLSQGAKPGKGGILPGAKVTAQIAKIRGIPIGKDCISPNAHSEFDTVDELIDFVELIAGKTGLPVGIKSAIGKIDFWHELAAKMKSRGEGPDFISVDGGEGGTGAAPLTFADHVSLPFKIGFERVYRIFQQAEVSKQVVWIGSGKLGFPDRTLVAFAMGVDMIQVAREAMISIGCIQALKCHTGHCPTGVATQNKWLQAGVNVEAKAKRFATYVKAYRKEVLSLAHAAGYEHPAQVNGDDIEFSSGVNRFLTLTETLGYRCDEIEFRGMASLADDSPDASATQTT